MEAQGESCSYLNEKEVVVTDPPIKLLPGATEKLLPGATESTVFCPWSIQSQGRKLWLNSPAANHGVLKSPFSFKDLGLPILTLLGKAISTVCQVLRASKQKGA